MTTAKERLTIFIHANANRDGINDMAGWLRDLDAFEQEVIHDYLLVRQEDRESKECPMCGGKGRIYNITEAVNQAIGEGAAMILPLPSMKGEPR